MEVQYTVIQAGGTGSRMGKYTLNRPKALVPVENRPLLWHVFSRLPKRKYIIIGDYKYDVLQKYLSVFCEEEIILVRTEEKGNASGIKEALRFIPEGEAFLLTWCDIYLPGNMEEYISPLPRGNYVATTNDFECGRTFRGHGVAGLFVFETKAHLGALNESGSFFGWLNESRINLHELPLCGIREFGTLASVEAVRRHGARCRPYNEIEFSEHEVLKKALTSQGEGLLDRERVWYERVSRYGFRNIPRIFSLKPLIMERITGDSVFSTPLSDGQKKTVLTKIVDSLKQLHQIESVPANVFDMAEDYYTKTLRRVRGIRDVIPFADQKYITINGRQCENILYSDERYRAVCYGIIHACGNFAPIHGDCTLTNTMLTQDHEVVFIDARGYFGKTELFGDPDYDWAKLYYSVAGNFDRFNIGDFTLKIGKESVTLEIASNGWEFLADELLERCGAGDGRRIKTIHAIVWISLASHCWEDYDSMCAAFYNGLYLLDEMMQ